MPGIEWVSTLDNSQFVSSMKQIQDTMRQSSQVLQSYGKAFNINNVVDQYITLTRVIQENETSLQKSRETVVQWMRAAEEARDKGDFTLFDSIQVDISDKLKDIETMVTETEEAKRSLNELMGMWGNLAGQKAPMLFDTQEEYDHVQKLKAEIADLQTQIANFNGSDADLEALRGQLSGLEEDLRKCELSAAQNAAKLGHAGAMAAEASTHYYELTNQIKEQEAVVGELTIKYNEAEQAYKKALGGSNVQDILDARSTMDAYAQGLDNARHSLISMKTEQEDFHRKMQQMSKGVSEAGSEIIGVFKNIAAVAGVSFTLSQAKQFVNEVVSIRSAMQDLETSMNIFLGSEEKAAAFNEQLKNYSMHSLYHYNELMAVSRQMLALGMDTEQAMTKMDQLANIAAATHASLSTVASMYQRAQTIGSVMNRQLVTWQNLGVNVKQVLKEMGEDTSKSTVSFEQLDKVINKVTSSGGKFANAQESMLGNISAEIDTYKNKMELMFNEIGEQYQDYITGVIKGGQWMIDHYKEIGTVIMDVIAAYGAYRAALVVVAATQKTVAFWENASAVATRINTAAKAGQATAVTTSTVAWRLATVSIKENTTAMLANAAAALTNPYVLLGAAVAAITFTVYKLATADDAETAARKRANEEAQKFADLMEERKNKINSLISVLHDETATAGQQARAWDELRQVVPTLTEGYTQAEFAAKSLDDTQKELNEDSEKLELEHARQEVEKYRKELEEATKLANQKGGGGMLEKLVNFFHQKDVDEATKMLEDAEEKLRKIQETINKGAEPKKIDDLEIKELLKGYEEASEKIDEINGKKVEPEVNSQAIQDAIGWTNGLQDELINLDTTQVKPGVSEEDIEKAKNEALGAISALKDLDSSVADPNVKREKIEEAEKKVKAVRDKLITVDGITAKPSVTIRGIDTAISKLKEAWDYLKKILGKGESEQQPKTVTKGGQTATKKDFKTEIANKVDAAKSDAEVNNYIKELNAKKEKAAYGSEERSFYEEQIKKLQDKKKKNSAKDNAKKSKERADANAKELQQKQKHEEDMLKLEEESRKARENAEIASIKDNYERERRERETQHKRELEQINKQNDEVAKNIYEARKKAYETANKNSHFELSDKGFGGDWRKLVVTNKEDARKLYTDEEYKQWKLTQEKMASEKKVSDATFARDEQEHYEDLIKQYQSYTDQRLEIEKDYNKEKENINAAIADAQSKGDTATVGALTRSLGEAAKKRMKNLSDVAMKELQDSPLFSIAWKDLGAVSTDVLNMLIDKFKEFESQFSADPQAMKEWTERIKAMSDEVVSRNPFLALTQARQEYSDAMDNIDIAKKEIDEQTRRLDATRKERENLDEKKKNIDKEIMLLEQQIIVLGVKIQMEKAEGKDTSKQEKDLAVAQEKLNLAKESQIKLDDEIKKKKEEENKATKALVDAQKLLGNATKIASEALDKQKEAGERIMGVVKGLSSAFKELGSDIGGTAGKVLEVIGGVMDFGVTLFNGIQQLGELTAKTVANVAEKTGQAVSSVGEATKATAQSAGKALSAMEKASVILTIISAAIQLIQQISELVPDAFDQYEDYRDKVNKTNMATKAVRDYQRAVLDARLAEKAWFSNTGLSDLSDQWERSGQALNDYFEKLTEEQAIYENETGGGWLTKLGAQASRTIAGIADTVNDALGIEGTLLGEGMKEMAQFGWANIAGGPVGAGMFAENKFWKKGLDKAYAEGTTAAYNNLRIETRSSSSGFLGTGVGGHSQQTEDLVEWAKKELGLDLFKEDGWLNTEAYEAIMENYADKLVGETKATLEELKKLQDQYEEFQETLKEYISELYSPLSDNIVDSLWDWYDEGTNVMDNFKKYAVDTFSTIGKEMLKTLVNDLIFDKYKEQLQDIYTEYSVNRANGMPAAKAIQQLNNEITKATDDFLDTAEDALPVLQDAVQNLRDGLAERGLDATTAPQQSATANSIQNISYDQAEAIEGTMLAQLIVQEQIKAILSEMSGITSANSGSDDSINNFIPLIQANEELNRQTGDLILSNIQTISGFINGDGGILSMMAAANVQRESIYKEMKGFVAKMESGFNKVVTELQNQ